MGFTITRQSNIMLSASKGIVTYARIKLSKLHGLVIDRFQNYESELKRLALDALDIKVYASTDRIEIQSVIPLE